MRESARARIQQKYLGELKEFPEIQALKGVVELPLLPAEVTGVKNIREFSELLVEDILGKKYKSL